MVCCSNVRSSSNCLSSKTFFIDQWESSFDIIHQHPQPCCCDWFWSLAFSLIWSGKSLYNSPSVSCARAFLATVWNACSTFIASFADVSKYGISPLLWHQLCARFVDTCKNNEEVMVSAKIFIQCLCTHRMSCHKNFSRRQITIEKQPKIKPVLIPNFL